MTDWLTPALALEPGPNLDAVFAERCLWWTPHYEKYAGREARFAPNGDKVFVQDFSMDPAASARYVRPWLRERGAKIVLYESNSDSNEIMTHDQNHYEAREVTGSTWEHALVRLALTVAARGEQKP